MKKEYSTKEFADALGVSHDTVARWVKTGKVKGRKIGPFAGKTSPILIYAGEFERVQKLLEARAGSSKTQR